MVTFCLGSARQKREYVKSVPDAVVLDNTEVLFCASENGLNYFAYGKIPFADFTVDEYLRYSRALCKQKVEDGAVLALGLDPSAKLGRLSPVELRSVAFLARTCGATDRTVIVNLDGTRYTRRRFAQLRTLLARCGEAYVFVTDERFVKRLRSHKKILMFGKKVRRRRPRFYGAKLLAERLGATRVSVM